MVINFDGATNCATDGTFFKLRFKQLLTQISLAASLLSIIGCDTSGTAPDFSEYVVRSGCSTCKIFITNSPYNGAIIGGAAAADLLCMTDPSKPLGDQVFKAMLAVPGERRACLTPNCSGGYGESLDWPLRPNRTYIEPVSLATVTTTNSKGLPSLPLQTALRGLPETHWIGLEPNFTSTSELDGTTCSGWTSSSVTNSGKYGIGNAVDSAFFGFSLYGECNQPRKLVCVQTGEGTGLPSAFSITSAVAGSGSVTLSWAASANVLTYTIAYGTTSGNYTVLVPGGWSSPAVITGLTSGVTYYFRVTAHAVNGSKESDNQISAAPL